MSIENIPKNIIYMILLNLKVNDINNFSCMNKKFKNISDENYLWELLLKRDFPNTKKCQEIFCKNWYMFRYKSIKTVLKCDNKSEESEVECVDFWGNKKCIVWRPKNIYSGDYLNGLWQWNNYYIIKTYDCFASNVLTLNKNDNQYELIYCRGSICKILMNDEYLFLIDIWYGDIDIYHQDIHDKKCLNMKDVICDNKNLKNIIKEYNNTEDIPERFSNFFQDSVISNNGLIYVQNIAINFINSTFSYIIYL